MASALECEVERGLQIFVQGFESAPRQRSLQFYFVVECEGAGFSVIYVALVQVVSVVHCTVDGRHRVRLVIADFHCAIDPFGLRTHNSIMADFRIQSEEQNSALFASFTLNFGEKGGKGALVVVEVPNSDKVGNNST